jgi:hypothetical protein
MSVSNVTSVSGVARVVLPVTVTRPQDPAVPAESTAKAPSKPSAAPEETTKTSPTDEAPQLRYPWLSRLARQLEPVSPQPSPYGTVELLGERLDKQA